MLSFAGYSEKLQNVACRLIPVCSTPLGGDRAVQKGVARDPALTCPIRGRYYIDDRR